MKQKLGTVTVGQSPRSDMLPTLMEGMGQDIHVIEKGALDKLSLDKIEALSPEMGMAPLCTRLWDGAQVVVAKEKIIPLVQDKIDELNEEGVELIVLLCTGHFPRFKSDRLVVEAQKLVDHAVEAVIDERNRMGLMVPLGEQVEQMKEALSHITPQITAVNASPYGPIEALQEAATHLNKAQVDLIVMHCVGFTNDHRKIVKGVAEKPVILAASVVGRMLGELLQT
jgi:protein AroM